MDQLLHRLIGEDVQLQTVLDPKLARVKLDPGQFEQVIMNLALNARDAMSSGGILTLETANVFLEEDYTPAQFHIKTGEYVMLAVSDNGIGMDSATQARIFEPFFTTKEPGRGTGLGLATIYGIVKQSEGYIWVYSTPDVGTTFKIYLPKCNESVEPNTRSEEPDALLKAAALHGAETVLVVEDEEAVRGLLRQALQSYGYKVLTARHGLEGLALLSQSDEKIDLILSDLIMPQMGGVELARALRQKQPKIKLVVMSGYTDRVAIQQGVVALCDRYIQKPFSPRQLLVSIREVLDSEGLKTLKRKRKTYF
jgi:CheY-like chemotaxis protein